LCEFGEEFAFGFLFVDECWFSIPQEPEHFREPQRALELFRELTRATSPRTALAFYDL